MVNGLHLYSALYTHSHTENLWASILGYVCCRSGRHLVWLLRCVQGPASGGLWAVEVCPSAVPVGQHLAMQLDSRVQCLEQRVALSGVELKGALARLTPPPSLKGEAGLFLGPKEVLNDHYVQYYRR